MGTLTDILAAGGYGGDKFFDGTTQPAGDFEPLPPGWYVCHADKGELRNAVTGTPGYSLCFKVIEGEHTGRLCWHDLWLTPLAKPYTMRDLLKLGIDADPKLEQPVPPGIRCKVCVALRKDDNGNEVNKVRRFDVIGIDEVERDAFAPDETTDDESKGGRHE